MTSIKYVLLDGTQHWLLDGKLHREDGPAIIYTNGSQKWYWGGKIHREGGPAIEWINGGKHWFIHGKLHREDGPAIVYPSHKAWYLNDQKINCSSNEEFLRLVKLKAFW